MRHPPSPTATATMVLLLSAANAAAATAAAAPSAAAAAARFVPRRAAPAAASALTSATSAFANPVVAPRATTTTVRTTRNGCARPRPFVSPSPSSSVVVVARFSSSSNDGDGDNGGEGGGGAGKKELPKDLPASTASWMNRSAGIGAASRNNNNVGGAGSGGRWDSLSTNSAKEAAAGKSSSKRDGRGRRVRKRSGGAGRDDEYSIDDADDNGNNSSRRRGGGREQSGGGGGSDRSFREDFRGTRVFVQGIPEHVNWQELKDHFRVAGDVVFASVSTDARTGRSKGCGVVQFETTAMARNAIKIMRDHPLDGSDLYVREDYQESSRRDGGGGDGFDPNKSAEDDDYGFGTERRLRRGGGGADDFGGRRRPPSTWRCANDEDGQAGVDDAEKAKILDLVMERDAARRDGDYDTSDAMREELKSNFDVHVDDRLKLWWKSVDGGVPAAVVGIKGSEGRWTDKLQPWRQIPTTPDNDARYDPDLVVSLLRKRDEARRRKDFDRADALLEEARTSPDGDLYLRVHDESRTFRVWTDEPPPRREWQQQPQQQQKTREPMRHRSQEDAMASAREQCLELVSKHDRSKVDEVKTLLSKFPGREYSILKKLKQRYEVD